MRIQVDVMQHMPRLIFWIIVSGWFYFWCLNIFIPFARNFPHVINCYVKPLDSCRYRYAYDQASADYYNVLALSDAMLEPGKKVSIILQKEPENRYFFLREKGRYYLYPRNYGMNDEASEAILVYGVKDYEMPPNYQMKFIFSKDKFLIEQVKSEGQRQL